MPQGRQKKKKSAMQMSTETAIKRVNAELKAMKDAGGDKARPNKFKELQDKGLKLAEQLRKMRRAN